MANLLTNKTALKELTDHIGKREGTVPYFYCDNKGFVTIGTGTLVDGSNPLSIFLKNNPNLVFRHKRGKKKATAAEITTDWSNVKKSFNAQRPQREDFYDSITKLEIDEASSYYLMMKEVRMSIANMYKQRPFSKNLDEYIQMAIIDVRYNPAGINPIYTGTRQTIPFWKYLNSLNLENAFKEFHRLWYVRIANGESINKIRYLGRQSIRERWFRKGIQQMQVSKSTPAFTRDTAGVMVQPFIKSAGRLSDFFF